MPSSPVLLHIYCPYPLSCCIYPHCPHPVSHSPKEGYRSPKVLGKYYSYLTGVFVHGYLRASTSEIHAHSETVRIGAAAGHSGESGQERHHAGTTPHNKRDVGSGYTCYYCCMPPSPVLLHIYCPYPGLILLHMPSSPVLLHIYCTCFSTVWNYILQHFNFTPLFR